MNKQKGYLRRLWMTALVLVVLPGLSSCSYLSIPAKDDVVSWPTYQKGKNGTPTYNSAVIKGRMTGADRDKGSTLVLAYRLADGGAELADHVAIDSTGAFILYLPQGRYHLYAMTDCNHNGIYEHDEISGVHGSFSSPQEISIQENELVTGIVMHISRCDGHATSLPWDALPNRNQDIVQPLTYNGQVLKIYHENFSPENAQTGYWHPSSFMKTFGAHIYLTEEYNPRKIPILFVHGTEGSPYNWIYLYMRLDRSRYQPWFFYYPSGIRLALAAALLDEELRELQKKYGFQKMGLVAHSVGGLTARSFLNRFVSGKQNEFIKLFVTLATPWSGFGIADASRHLPHKSIPVWLDLGTKSAFIQATLAGKLPPTVKHYVFYGKNDKLCGDTALDDRVVAHAVKTDGFDCTHDSILSDRKVSFRFKEILDKEL